MDKEAIALIIAQNGLGTAAALLTGKKIKLERQFAKAKPEDQAAIRQKIQNTEKLAVALRLANDGIISYQAETA